MPAAVSRADPFREYAWVLLVAAILIGVWLTRPMSSGTGSDSIHIEAGPDGSEQSLSALDPTHNPQGAPGGLVDPDSVGKSGSYSGEVRNTQASSLYQAPGGAAGAPITEANAAAAKEGEGAGVANSLAAAMARVAGSGKAPDNSWGGKEARTGFSKPKAQFGKPGESRSGGGDSTSAQFTVVQKAFGTGGDPGLQFSPGAPGGANRTKGGIREGNNVSLDALKKAEKASLDSLKGKDESAAGFGRNTFDAAQSGGKTLSQLAASGATAGLTGGDGVPMNLKANDPRAFGGKEFEPPEIKAAGEISDDKSKEYMQQKIMMMILSAAITGIMGPTAGAIGAALVQGIGLEPPKDMNKVQAQSSAGGSHG